PRARSHRETRTRGRSPLGPPRPRRPMAAEGQVAATAERLRAAFLRGPAAGGPARRALRAAGAEGVAGGGAGVREPGSPAPESPLGVVAGGRHVPPTPAGQPGAGATLAPLPPAGVPSRAIVDMGQGGVD
ncbi:unnamed protein product, partial [Prorocentrum cordatum]